MKNIEIKINFKYSDDYCNSTIERLEDYITFAIINFANLDHEEYKSLTIEHMIGGELQDDKKI